jgi:osmotically inducible lipoprotein OsmB
MRNNAMKRILLISVFSLSMLGLAACGSSTSDRALTGGGIGAGVGLVGGALVGAPIAGAAIGGAVGAGTGALTDEDDIDLGEPLWD